MIKDFLFILLSCTWGIIMTTLGFGFMLFQVLRHIAWKTINPSINVISKVTYFKGTVGFTLTSNIGGVSLGMFYFVGYHDHPFTHTHERGHSIQNIIWGPLFLPVIGIPSIVRAAFWPLITKRARAAGKPSPDYYRVWFERQANTLGAYLDGFTED